MNNIKNRIALVCLFFFFHAHGFNTLSEIKEYTARTQEFPPYQEGDWAGPNYTNYYKEFTGRALPESSRLWSAHAFADQLTSYINQANKEKNDPIVFLKLPETSFFYTWMNIQGSIHSLYRSLSYLQQQGVISDDLVLANPNTYFVFNGNCIGKGPYNLETLSVILSLKKKNPNNVFYIAGEQERLGTWKNFNTKTELQIKAQSISSDRIPLEKELVNVFASLPEILFVANQEKPTELLRFSYQDQELQVIQTNSLCDSFNNAPSGVSYFKKIKKNKKQKKCADVQVVIKSNEQLIEYLANVKGMGLVFQDEGATTWSILSAPIETYKKFLEYTYDAFAKITINQRLNASTIQLYNHSITESTQTFTAQDQKNLLSGAPTTLYSQPPQAIELGSLIARQSLVGGTETRSGLFVRINQANQTNEIPGKYIRLHVLDDQYIPNVTREKLEELKARKVNIFIVPFGTPTTQVYLDQVRKGEILVLFPQSGSGIFSDPSLDYMFHFKGNNVQATHALIDYLIKKFNARKFALYFQDDAFGRTPLEAAKDVFKKYPNIEWIEVPYTRGILELAEQAQKIKSFQPDALGLFSFGGYTQELIRNIGVDSLTNTIIFGTFDAGDISSRRFFKKVGLDPIYLSANVPNPAVSKLSIVEEYRRIMSLYGIPYDTFGLEAYMAATITVDAIKNIQGPITKESIKEKLKSYSNYNLDGLSLTFNPQNRSLSNSVWFEKGPEKPWEKIS